jgi:hypothetical protein
MPRHRTSTKIMCGLLAVLASMGAMLVRTPPASAQDLAVVAGHLDMGYIIANWEGEESIDDDHLDADYWTIVGGDPELPLVNVLADIDTFSSGTHLVLSNVEIELFGQNCTVTFDGPLLLDDVGGGTFAGYFDKDQLGGISYSIGCTVGWDDLLLVYIDIYGVELAFVVAHV